MGKLKACPFCGGKAIVVARKCNKAKYGIGCENNGCSCWIPEDVHLRELHNYVPCWVKLEDAIKAWNTRTIKTMSVCERGIIKARIEELEIYENLRNRKDNYEAPYITAILNISIMASKRIAELKKGLK